MFYIFPTSKAHEQKILEEITGAELRRDWLNSGHHQPWWLSIKQSRPCKLHLQQCRATVSPSVGTDQVCCFVRWFEWKMSPTGSGIWTLGAQLVALCGELQPCWRKPITRSWLWESIFSPTSHFLLNYQCIILLHCFKSKMSATRKNRTITVTTGQKCKVCFH